MTWQPKESSQLVSPEISDLMSFARDKISELMGEFAHGGKKELVFHLLDNLLCAMELVKKLLAADVKQQQQPAMVINASVKVVRHKRMNSRDKSMGLVGRMVTTKKRDKIQSHIKVERRGIALECPDH